MAVRVDDESGRLALGEDGRAFELDASSGTARIELGGEFFEVRPLRWRQKLLLARYASLGAAFVRRQFLEACVGAHLPSDPREQAALWELVVWINAPDGISGGLPLETAVLTSATVVVCRAMGLRPADLDAREALEVEALFQVAGGAEAPTSLGPLVSRASAAAPARPHPGARTVEPAHVNRIRVLPDPGHAAPTDVEPPYRADEAVSAPRRPEQAGATPAAAQAGPAASGQPVSGRFRLLRLQPLSDPGRVERARGVGPMTAPAWVECAPGVATTTGIEPIRGHERAATIEVTHPGTPPGATGFAGPPPAAPTWPWRSPETRGHGVSAASTIAAAGAVTAAMAAPPAPVSADDLLDELVDRLEHAASEMGIDLDT